MKSKIAKTKIEKKSLNHSHRVEAFKKNMNYELEHIKNFSQLQNDSNYSFFLVEDMSYNDKKYGVIYKQDLSHYCNLT